MNANSHDIARPSVGDGDIECPLAEALDLVQMCRCPVTRNSVKRQAPRHELVVSATWGNGVPKNLGMDPQPLTQVDPVEDLTFGHTARARLSQTDHSVLGAEDAIHSRGIHAVPRSTQCCFGESNVTLPWRWDSYTQRRISVQTPTSSVGFRINFGGGRGAGNGRPVPALRR